MAEHSHPNPNDFELSEDMFRDKRDLTSSGITAQQDWEEYVHDIFVNPAIKEHKLQGYELNPIPRNRRQASRLGMIALKGVRTTAGCHPVHPLRTHRLYTIEQNGFHHAVEITDPVDGDPSYLIGSFPGFTEKIENGLRNRLHNQLSYEFPEARIVSVGSNGIGSTGSRFGWNERSIHGVEAMGSQRLSLLANLGGLCLPVATVGTSMGSVIEHRLAHENLFGNPETGPIDLRVLFGLSPAIVDPKYALMHMGVRFIPQLVRHLGEEVAMHPIQVLKLAPHLRHMGLNRHDVTALVVQAFDLLHGTKQEDFVDVIERIPMGIVAGEKDILAQWKMMEETRSSYPSKLFLKKLPGIGHQLPMYADTSCKEIVQLGSNLMHHLSETKIAS